MIDTLTVYPLPVVNFLADSVCLGDTTHFGDLTIIPSGNAVSWSWDFGDGIFLSGQNPTHIYTKPGTYLVTLTVTSDHGCISNVTLPVKVFPLPNANFSYSPASPIHLTDMTSFKDLSTGGPVQWNWWFGDDSTSSEQSPSHLYNDTGTFIVTLAIMDAHGCKDTVREPVEILDYTFYIPNAFTPNNDGKNEFFFGEGIGIKEYEMWIFDRWGNRIYYCHVDGLPQQPGCWWNGKVDGGYSNEIVQQDVYVWKVHLTSVFDKTYDYVGTVTVVK